MADLIAMREQHVRFEHLLADHLKLDKTKVVAGSFEVHDPRPVANTPVCLVTWTELGTLAVQEADVDFHDLRRMHDESRVP